MMNITIAEVRNVPSEAEDIILTSSFRKAIANNSGKNHNWRKQVLKLANALTHCGGRFISVDPGPKGAGDQRRKLNKLARTDLGIIPAR